MLRILGDEPNSARGITRREWLRVGGIGLGGLSLPGLLRSRVAMADALPVKAKSVIVLFHSGGVAQHEAWDPKPDAPEEVRGEFGTIATRTPGLFVSELMPKLAKLTDRMAVIRTVVTGDNAHSSSGYQMLTGMPHTPLSRENAAPGKPNDWPSYNALVQALRPANNGLPASVALPRRLANNNGQDPWPGTDAGFLGRKLDPWLLECDPSEADFCIPGCKLPEGLPPLRLDRRLSLLQQVEQRTTALERGADSIANYDLYQQQALSLIAGGKARDAFDLKKEPDEMRDRYGRTRYGQSVLLARRLVEAGVSLIQVQWADYDKSKPNSGGWDTHLKHNESVKGWLMPKMDQVCSTLIEDLEDRGLLDETLICMVSEFGHTPKFNRRAGRDHWGKVFSIALAGGGVRGGVVYGQSDTHAAEPLGDVVRPSDYLATVFHCLGYAPETVVYDPLNRPLPISRGRVVASVLS